MIGNYLLMNFDPFRTILDRFWTSQNHESEMSSRPLEKYQWWWYFTSQRSSFIFGKKWKSVFFWIWPLDDLGWCLWTLYVWSGDMICGLETWYMSSGYRICLLDIEYDDVRWCDVIRWYVKMWYDKMISYDKMICYDKMIW